MVGVGEEGLDSAVARITIVNWENVVILDTFVKVPVPVTDYRTFVSGITAQDIESDKALTFEEARAAVSNIIRGKILIGHGLENDLRALDLTHPESDVRDTACYAPYMQEIVDSQTGTLVIRPRKLRDLTREVLGRDIQVPGSPHCPVDDAIAAMDLYKVSRYDWEKELGRRQREKAEEEEKKQEERRWRYNFFWFSQPTPSSTSMYDPNDPCNMHHYLPITHDPRLHVTHPYAGGYDYPAYGTMLPQMVAPPPPPPPPPPPSRPPQRAPQQSTPTNSSFWSRFARPKTPPLAGQEKKVMDDSTEPSAASDVSFFSLDPASDESSDLVPDMECLTLDSKSRSMTTVASQETVPREDVIMGLPFFSEGHVWE
jgi:RNA exonuclease 4